MISTVVLFGFLLAATITDLRRRKVYNWTTYPGILVAFGLNGLAAAFGLDVESVSNDLFGLVGLKDSIAGFVGCGFVMLVCYVFFPGGVGGGDVKLIAMMGAFLGPFGGLEAMLWTFVLGGGMAIIILVWRFGAIRLLLRTIQWVLYTLRFRTLAPLKDEERERLKTDLFLSPSALAAVVIVQFNLIDCL
jgi:prepilin peptidase CpaA